MASSLFGLVTNGEVEELRQKIEENRKWQVNMSTWNNDFLVIINRTRDDVAKNREVINNMAEKTLKSIDMTHMIMTLQQQIHELEIIDYRTSAIIDDLERGVLTELLLPREILLSIVKESDLHVEWYYRWCTIRPLWNDGWVYETQLPVVQSEDIIGYEIINFPVFGPHNQIVKLDIARYAALDTRNGQVSQPRVCHGSDPLVCSHGPRTQQGCTTAVVTQQHLAPVCNVIQVQQEKKIFSLSENELVILVKNSTTFSQLCPNEEQRMQLSLPRGTHWVKWKAGCSLETASFSITAAQMPIGHRVVRNWHTPLNKFKLANYFRQKTYPTLLPRIIPLDLQKLPVPPLIKWYHRHDITSTVLWVIIAVFSISIISLIAWQSRCITKYCCGCKKQDVKDISKDQVDSNHVESDSIYIDEPNLDPIVVSTPSSQGSYDVSFQ